MEWDVSKVYTAANADELKVGSKVIVADTLDVLKGRVKRENLVYVLSDICDETYERRFEITPSSHFSLAYLVSEPEEKYLKWTDLNLGDIVTNGSRTYIVSGIDRTGKWGSHILFGVEWMRDEDLKDWEKVNC